MKHIFISYSRRDGEVMRRVKTHLLSEKLHVWTDENLTPGTRSWKHEIELALEGAQALVAILSPDSKKSHWVREEMNYAEAHDVRIFPILARGEIRTAVPFGIVTAQWVDIRQETSANLELLKLSETLKTHLTAGTTLKPAGPGIQTGPLNPSTAVTLDPAVLSVLSPDARKAADILLNTRLKWWRRADAAHLLGRLDDPQILPLLNALRDELDLEVRKAIRSSIFKLSNREPQQPEVFIELDEISTAHAPVVSVTSERVPPSDAGGLAEINLMCIEGLMDGHTWHFSADGTPKVMVGRGPNNQIIVPDTSISREHCLIFAREGEYHVEDLESTNGTFLNGIRLRTPQKLRDGDKLRLSNTLYFVVSDPTAATQSEHDSTA